VSDWPFEEKEDKLFYINYVEGVLLTCGKYHKCSVCSDLTMYCFKGFYDPYVFLPFCSDDCITLYRLWKM